MPNFKLYKAKIINPFENGKIEYYEKGILIVDDQGIIQFCGDEFENIDYLNYQVIDFCDNFIIPGMIDAHTHLPQYDEIGTASGELLDWLNNFIYPLEAKFDNYEFSYSKSLDFFKNLIQNGTTTAFVYSTIHYIATKTAFEAAKEIGINAYIGNSMSDISNYDNPFYSLEKNLEISKKLINEFHSNNIGKVNYIVTPRFAGSCSFELLTEVGKLSKNYDLYIQTHLSENISELDLIKKQFPNFQNYTEIYMRSGLTTDKTIFGHAIHLNKDEQNILKKSESIIAHCPNSNRYLSSGIMPLDKYIKNKMKIALGTDIGAGFYISLLNEAREAIESTKSYKLFINKKSDIIQANKLFTLTNIDAANALKINNKCGNFIKGKNADFVVINNEKIKGNDILNIINKLVYTSESSNIVETYISGKRYSKLS